MTPGDVIARGERARQLMTDVVMQDAFAAVEKIYVLEMRKCAATDDAGRYRYSQALNIIEGVKIHLREFIAQGALTEKQSQEFRAAATVKERVTRLF